METSSKLKICMLTDAWDPVWGGGQTHILEVSKLLVKTYGHSVDIVVPNILGDRKREFSLPNLRIVRIGPSFKFPNFLGRTFFVFTVAFFLLKSDFDIYHSHSFSTTLFFPLVKLIKKGKTVFTLHGVGTKVLGGSLLSLGGIAQGLSSLLIYGYKYDALITVAKKSLIKKTNTRLVRVIGNGVNLENFEKVSKKKAKQSFTFLWVGRFVPVKGLDILVKAAKEVVNHFPGVRFKLIGDGPEKKSIQALIKSEQLENYVQIENATYDRDLVKEFKSANAFILPSIEGEGFPITIVEAMAAKLPVVASDIGDTDKLVQDQKTGYLVKPGNIADLQNKIFRLLSNPHKSTMGIVGYNLIKENYTWDKITQQIHAVYLTILSS